MRTSNTTLIGHLSQHPITDAKNGNLTTVFTLAASENGETNWFNVTTSVWKNWLFNLQAGDQVKVTGQLREEVWKDPFDNSEYIIASLAASNIQRLAAAA